MLVNADLPLDLEADVRAMAEASQRDVQAVLVELIRDGLNARNRELGESYEIGLQEVVNDDLNSDGYPTKHTLERISKWPVQSPDNCRELLEHVRSLWHHSKYFQDALDGQEHVYKVSTCGWSGNEDLIEAMQLNRVFWSFCWYSSRRGGHYVFRFKIK